MKLESVSLDDVYPLVDEYGNEFTSRDYTVKANQQYVLELADSMRAKGEPDEPIILVRDGGIYRIKSGRTRYEAMKLLGTRKCSALVDEDDTVKGVLETVVRTDVKKRYEDVERSRYVQQLALFGDDDYVSETAGIEKEKVARIRRATKIVGDAGEDMTLDRLLLVDEFAGDDEAVAELVSCAEKDAQAVAARLRRERNAREKRKAFEAAFSVLDVPCVDRGEETEGKTYFLSVPSPADAAERVPESYEHGQVVAVIYNTWDGCRAELYVDPSIDGGSSENAERAEERRIADAYREAIRAADAAREEWFFKNLASGRPMPNLLRECEAALMENYTVKSVLDLMGEDGVAAFKNKGLSLLDYAIGYRELDATGARYAGCIARGSLDYAAGSAATYLDVIAFAQADGWDPDDACALIAKLSELVDGEGAEDGE